MRQKFTEKVLEAFIDSTRLFNSERQMERIPLDAEANIINKIRAGKYREIKCPSYDKLRDNIGVMARDELTNYCYLVVSSIALFSRAAMECGVELDLVFDSSDSLLFFLSEAKTLDEVHDIYQVAGTYYARQVYLQEQKNLSWQVDKIRSYINHHLFEKIVISDIAEYTGLTPNYMSNLFKDRMGISIHNYIQKEKIGIACNMLMHTDMSISDIAVYLGFKSQSNFGAVFKKWQHLTPTEYRDKSYREVY